VNAVLTRRLSEVRTQVNTYLTEFYKQKVSRASALHEDYGALWSAMESFDANHGKRLRPYVLLTAYQGLGGADTQDVLPVAVAHELLHASMLMHDDIIDRDYVRRGRANVAGQYRERYAKEPLTAARRDHYANAAALLAGDLAIGAAYEIIALSNLTSDQKVSAVRIISDSLFTVGGGELLDTEAVLLPFESVDTLTIVRLKTASYSFEYPLLTAAVLARADAATQQAVRSLGQAIGVAFQLADDTLSLFGDEAVTGKPATSDLEEAKRTYLMQQALGLCSPKQKSILEGIVGTGRVSAKQAEICRQIVRGSGALDKSAAVMHRYANEAQAALTHIPLSRQARAELSDFISIVVERAS
jgi:geranylgeranyl pyrophosphate synthase